MILNESQYSNSVQIYGKDFVDAVVKREPYLSQRFLMKMCEFSYREHIPFEKIRLLFSRIQENNLNIPNINCLSYQELTQLVDQSQQRGKPLFDNPYYVSPDSMVEIYLIHNFSEIQRLPFNNSWCIKDEGDYNYHAFDKSTTMYLIHNKQYSKRSNMRYVMAEVYPKNSEEDEQTVYWTTNNNILNGSIMKSYVESLGDGASKIQLIPLEESLNNTIYKRILDNTMNTNKKVIRLTESELHNIITESVRQVLGEMDWRSYANGGKKAKEEFRNMIKWAEKDDPNLLKRIKQAKNLLGHAVEKSRDKFKDINDDDNTFYTTVDGNGLFYPNVENSSWDGHTMQMDKDGKTKMRGLSKPKMVNVSPERYLGYNAAKVSDWNRFSKEITDFNNGNSRYIKGKGWQ